MNFSINYTTWIWLIAILLVFLVCVALVVYFKKNDKLVSNRRIIEYFPTFVSTLGVLGTFYGITIGLLAFDTGDLDNSIPGLLDGLKTAFFTSLAGMIGSMILSAFISHKQDENDGGVSDINQAAGEIVQAVKDMSEENKRTLQALNAQSQQQAQNQTAFYNTAGQILQALNTNIAELNGFKNSFANAINSLNSLVVQSQSQSADTLVIKELTESLSTSMGNVEEKITIQAQATSGILNAVQNVPTIDRNISEMVDITAGMSTGQDEIIGEIKSIEDKLHGEVVSIEETIRATNKLLSEKFDEFSELLKKSNTEALVEVMKKVTEEFQKQMNALINKLIQENFDQLNKSVERLNTWQQENKEMISSLTKQYKEMSTNFEATSTSLSKVKDDTTSLVSEGGKLRKLIDALNKVIIEDEKFLKLTTDLQKTADLSKSNMESFDKSTNALNEWVRKQRNFVDGVTALIEKLDEINKINDYNEQFWQNTKRSLEEGVGFISQGSQTLNRQLTDLDRQFYARLSTTLAELDTCIQAMVNGR